MAFSSFACEAGEPVENRIVPVYPEVEGLRPPHVRRIVKRALPAARQLVDVIPARFLDMRRLPNLRDAIGCLHRPQCEAEFRDLHNSATPWYRERTLSSGVIFPNARKGDFSSISKVETIPTSRLSASTTGPPLQPGLTAAEV